MANLNNVPSKENILNMSKLLKVFADDTRLKILYSLLDGEKCVSQIQQEVEMSQSAVSHQLSVLRNSNLVRRVKRANLAIYCLADEHIKTILQMVYDHILEV